VDSLADILEALGTTLAEFFTDKKQTTVVYSPAERVAVEGKGARRFELLVPGSTNNLMDPIFVELGPGEKLERQGPHPGEQFGFIIKGTATLKLDRAVYRVPSKHCFYFESDRTHQIINASNSVVQFLWITTPPQM
jgi:mannose-6-phosphate isomerase-like protein (cupin superfamily)